MRQVIKFFKTIGIILIIDLVIIFIIGYLRKVSINGYKNLLLLFGGINLALGLMSIIGNGKNRSNPSYVNILSTFGGNRQKLTEQELESTDKSFKFLIYMGLSGMILILLTNL